MVSASMLINECFTGKGNLLSQTVFHDCVDTVCYQHIATKNLVKTKTGSNCHLNK